jgi:hypothetical protein
VICDNRRVAAGLDHLAHDRMASFPPREPVTWRFSREAGACPGRGCR